MFFYYYFIYSMHKTPALPRTFPQTECETIKKHASLWRQWMGTEGMPTEREWLCISALVQEACETTFIASDRRYILTSHFMVERVPEEQSLHFYTNPEAVFSSLARWLNELRNTPGTALQCQVLRARQALASRAAPRADGGSTPSSSSPSYPQDGTTSDPEFEATYPSLSH
jgi:hypothetical protein